MGQQQIGVLDLYCGMGGLSIGLEMTSGFEVLGGIDIYEPALDTFRIAHPGSAPGFHGPTDISGVRGSDLRSALGREPELIVGGPPCQGWSAAGRRLTAYKEDPRNRQVFEFLRIVREIRPPAFLMENVSGIKTTGQSRKNQLLEQLCDEYRDIGYEVVWKVLDASRYRVPQRRKRLFLVGTRKDMPSFVFPPAPCGDAPDLFSGSEATQTVWDALGDLPAPEDRDPQGYNGAPESPLQWFLRANSDQLHNHLDTNHRPETVEKLRKQEVGSRLYDWNHSWYRLDPTQPSPTIKMNNRAPAVHFREPRLISPRECARLQTIPDRVRISGNKTQQLTQVGNAVPSILAAHLGTALLEQVFRVTPAVIWDDRHNPLANG